LRRWVVPRPLGEARARHRVARQLELLRERAEQLGKRIELLRETTGRVVARVELLRETTELLINRRKAPMASSVAMMSSCSRLWHARVGEPTPL
jgi:hypothetical protein